jgi:hypothetical protein
VSGEIDKEYRRLRSIESGIRGSSRMASMKLDPAWGYRVLRQDYPFLARLADKGKFAQLVEIIRKEGVGSSERTIAALIERDEATAGLLSPSLEQDSGAGQAP